VLVNLKAAEGVHGNETLSIRTMERPNAHHVPRQGNAPGAEARFAFDRMAIERFRRAFPRARWSDERKSWFVPGKTATRRIDRWLAQEAELLALHGDSKGRDVFAFDPISSSYLEVSDDLRVRTPYSKTVLEELQAIPWASWDDELRAWRVPFRSFEELRRRWPSIEKAARHAEPEERKRRREAARGTEAHKASKMRKCRTSASSLSTAGRRFAASRPAGCDSAIRYRRFHRSDR